MAGGLLLAALGYDWLGNVAHEIFGTAMFLLLITHNTFNRRWYGSAVESVRDARGWLNTASIFALLVTMLTLLVTSLMISRTVFSFLPLSSSFGPVRSTASPPTGRSFSCPFTSVCAGHSIWQ